MKVFFTIVSFFFFISLQAQLQLDSIVTRDIEFNELEDFYSFTYEDGKLSHYVEGELDVNLVIKYNEQGLFKTWTNLSDEEFFKYEFIYDADNQLDSLILGDGYSFTLVYDILMVDDKIINFKETLIYDSYTEDGYLREYSYDNNGRLTGFIDYDFYSSTQYAGEIRFQYTDDDLIRKIDFYDSEMELSFTDSINYTNDGNIISHYEIDHYDNEIFDAINIFNIDESVSFDDINSPVELYDIIFHISDIDYVSFYLPMLINKVNSHSTEDNIETISTWYYSLFVGLIDQPIVATPIAVYPNPTADFVQFKSEKEITNYSIYTMNGQLVKSGKMYDKMISVSDLTTGKYTLVGHDKEGKNYFAAIAKM